MRRVTEAALTEENIGGGPADQSFNTRGNSAATCAFTLAAANPNLPPCDAPRNASRTGWLSTASEPSAKPHGFAAERMLTCNPAWPVMAWQFVGLLEAADCAKHPAPGQADAHSGPATSATAIRHATSALPAIESRFAWPITNIINPFTSSRVGCVARICQLRLSRRALTHSSKARAVVQRQVDVLGRSCGVQPQFHRVAAFQKPGIGGLWTF